MTERILYAYDKIPIKTILILQLFTSRVLLFFHIMFRVFKRVFERLSQWYNIYLTEIEYR